MLDDAKKTALGDIRKVLKDGLAGHLKKKLAPPKDEGKGAIHVTMVKAEPEKPEEAESPEEEAAESPEEEASEGSAPDMKSLILGHLESLKGGKKRG